MALNIKSTQVEELATEVALLAGESKTEAIRKALLERRDRLKLRISPERRTAHIERFLEQEIWARIPKKQLGKAPTKQEREKILGYGPEGV